MDIRPGMGILHRIIRISAVMLSIMYLGSLVNNSWKLKFQFEGQFRSIKFQDICNSQLDTVCI